MRKSKVTKIMVKKFRCTEEEWNRITILAGLYAGGNVSKWLRYSALSARRKFLK
jgi:hypothetical protein